MKFNSIIYFAFAFSLLSGTSGTTAQTKLSKEEWQKQIVSYTAQRDDLKKLLATLAKDIDSLKTLLASLDERIKSVHQETMAMTGASDEHRRAFEEQLSKLERWADELARLADQDLYNRKVEVDSLQAQLDGLKKMKLAAIQQYYDRLQALQQKVDGLKASLARIQSMASMEKTYVVGTWQKDRDCLWNISKKKTIYDNPFMWPKIWQGNRDQIKDPDLIYKGQKLKIPAAGPLTDVEKKAQRQYYSKKKGLAAR